MKDIIKALKVYQEIYKLMTGQQCEKVRGFIEFLKPYERKSFEEFQFNLAKDIEPKKSRKIAKVDVVQLGKDFYEMKQLHSTNSEVTDYIELAENVKIKEVLTRNLSEAYAAIEGWDLKTINMSQLNFLGYALLNSELRGKTKKDRKKNLLQLLWKVIETEKMNEIYENNLL